MEGSHEALQVCMGQAYAAVLAAQVTGEQELAAGDIRTLGLLEACFSWA